MKVQIYKQELNGGGELVIIIGGLGSENPKAILDKAVKTLTCDEAYNEFIDIHLDNPWIRVVIMGINQLDFKDEDI